MTPLLAAVFTLVFHQPADCGSPCERFADAVKHPAMQRRLAAMSASLEIRPAPEKEVPSIALHDAGGRQVMRWHDTPDWLMLSEILTLLEIATPHLNEAHRATVADDRAIAEREFALAVLSLGDRNRGRALLKAMRESQSVENQQLAAVWLERVDKTRTEDVLTHYAREGATDRVRIDAWMAIGDSRLDEGRYEDAIEAYDRAADVARDRPNSLQNARIARDRAVALTTPVLGLGTPDSVIAGRRSVQPRNAPKSTASVEFHLDGKRMATAKKPPFVASINFGRIPSRQVLETVARDRSGKVIERARYVVNERSEAFRVAFVEPADHYLSGPIDVTLDVRVPQGRTVDQVAIEWNGRRVARLTTPPYRTRVTIGQGESGVLRAVLRLEDGSETEDVHLANTGAMVMETEAHVVEVPAYFEGTPPAAREVTAREGGKPRTIDRVVPPGDAPLLIALLIDSSRSMIEHMLDVQEAAVRFVQAHLEPRDQAMVVAFSGTARVIQRATNNRALLERAILALRPKGSTALHDAIITSLLQLQSTGSRKALVVFSDGLDAVSVFSQADVAEVAKRAGVPVYVLAFTPEGAAFEPRVAFAKNDLMSISRRTGAKAFDMRTLDELDRLWNEIGEDLKRQSLVIYRTDSAGTEWRPLELTVKGKPVRAPSGVYVTAEGDR